MSGKSKIIRQVKLQTILLALVICTFSGLCYANMFRKNELGNTIEECKSSLQEAEDIFQKIDAITKWLDNSWSQSIIKKSTLGKIDSGYTYMMTQEIASKQVIKGKEGWLFYNSIGDGDTIGDFEGTNLHSDEQIEKMSVGVLHTQNSLNYHGIEFQLLICPNKEMIYHEYMPNMYTRAEKTNGDVLHEAFTEKGINVVYPKKLLEANKYYPLYYMYDTHWNQLGAYVATREVLAKWGIAVDVLLECTVNSMSLKDCQHLSARQDLASMAGVLPILEARKADFEYVVEGTADIDWEQFASDEEAERPSHFYNPNARVKKTLLLVGDSFRVAMVPLLSEIFEKVYVSHRGYYESDLLNQVNPDYVLAEYVERYTDEIAELDDLILK